MRPAMAARITVVGLGPGDPSLRTLGAQRALDDADRIVLRTRIHPGLDDLAGDPRVADCDDLYERAATFDDVYAAIAERVCNLALTVADTVVYAVPGHPRFGERSVRLLAEEAGRRGVPIEVQAAVSALDAIAAALAIDPMADGVQVIDATSFAIAVEHQPFAGGLVTVDPHRPCLVVQVYTPSVAAATKLALSRLYPEEHPIVIVAAAGIGGLERLVRCPLYEFDRQPVDHLTSVWLPPLPALEAHRHPQTLQRIVARLRAPGGCPWDRSQTHQSLRDAVIEEAYETIDAIDGADAANLAEELGDVLLQVALHAQIAEESGDFTLEEVCEHVSQKLLRRHPHVFGTADARTPEEVVATWEAVKAVERADKTGAGDPDDPLGRLPRSMPALIKAVALIRSGAALHPASGDGAGDSPEAVGARLLAAVESAVRVGVDPERALDAALRRRFGGGPAAETGTQPTRGKVPA